MPSTPQTNSSEEDANEATAVPAEIFILQRPLHVIVLPMVSPRTTVSNHTLPGPAP